MAWDFSGDKAVYLQIMDEIKIRIISGSYPVGTKLPSVRDLAEEARVNPNTMQKALFELEREELIISQRTSGKFVTCDEQKIVSAREHMSSEHITDFLGKMKKLGFTPLEASEKISRCAMAEKQNGENGN